MKQRRVESVAPTGRGFQLEIGWNDNSTGLVDLSEPIRNLKVFRPLRNDPAAFAAVEVGEWGWSIRWSDDLDVSVDTLWRLQNIQAGEAMPVEDFVAWRKRNGLTQEAAAKVLGLSRRTIVDYEMARHLIPKSVMLATRGYESPRKDLFMESRDTLEGVWSDLDAVVEAQPPERLAETLKAKVELLIPDGEKMALIESVVVDVFRSTASAYYDAIVRSARRLERALARMDEAGPVKAPPRRGRKPRSRTAA